MDKLKQFDLMEKITRELEDLKNSQTAIVQKIGKIEVDNIELGNKTLDRILPVMHQNVADNLDKIAEIIQNFEDTKNNFSRDHNIEALREQEAIRGAMEGGEKQGEFKVVLADEVDDCSEVKLVKKIDFEIINIDD